MKFNNSDKAVVNFPHTWNKPLLSSVWTVAVAAVGVCALHPPHTQKVINLWKASPTGCWCSGDYRRALRTLHCFHYARFTSFPNAVKSSLGVLLLFVRWWSFQTYSLILCLCSSTAESDTLKQHIKQNRISV